MWDELTILWNDLTILWNDLTIDWNDRTWNDLTMERNDRIPIASSLVSGYSAIALGNSLTFFVFSVPPRKSAIRYNG